MKLNRNALIVLLVGFVVLLTGAIMPFACPPGNGAEGIVGGADAPTYMAMLRSLFGGLPFVLVLVGIGLTIPAAFCLIFSKTVKTVKTHCSLRTSAVAMGLSAAAASAIVYPLWWFSVFVFSEWVKNTALVLLSVGLGLLILPVVIVLIVVYIKLRKKKWSALGLIIDLLTSLFYFQFIFLPLLVHCFRYSIIIN